jgi:hypothetical protein
MTNPFDDIRAAVQHAREVNRACDQQANTLTDLLEGRLRHVSPYRLARLKKELQNFNAHKKEWK